MKDIKIYNGDIVIAPNSFPEIVSGIDEIIQRIGIAASFKKGCFAYDRNMGLFSDTPDFNSDNILSTIESLMNETLVGTGVYVCVNGVSCENGEYSAAITISDGFRKTETEVRING